MEESLDFDFVPDVDKEFEYDMMSMLDSSDTWLLCDEIMEYIQEKEYENYCKSFSEEYNSEGE